MRRLWVWTFVLLFGVRAFAQDTSTTAKKSVGERIGTAVLMLYVSPGTVPQYIFHESMHKVAFKALGVPSKLVVTHAMPWDFDADRLHIYTKPDTAIAHQKIGESAWKGALLLFLPEVGDLLLRDRLAEYLLRGTRPHGGCWVTNCVYFPAVYSLVGGSVFFPINPIVDYDMRMASTFLGVKPWKLKLAFEALYLYSGWRVYNSAYHK